MKTLFILNAHNIFIFIFLLFLSTIFKVSGSSTAGVPQISKLNISKTNPPIKRTPEIPSTTPTLLQSKNCNKVKTVKVFKPIALASSAALLTIFLFLLGFTMFWRLRRREHQQINDEEKPAPGVVVTVKKQQHCRRFTLDEIRSATHNFDPDLKIGDGGYGRVYKGYIDNDKENPVAVKVLKSMSNSLSMIQVIHEFWLEIETISKLRHPNLVPLIGYCDDEQFMIIVYDYMSHGTLRDHLYGTSDSFLTWKERLAICIGAARGLAYLHAGPERGIIHRDIKTTNILLDENWVAKVSDFGLSRMGPESPSKSHVTTTDARGTFGYLDPEYFRTRHLNAKSDVYGFGVVLFEVLCGRAAVDMNLDEEQQSLAQWAKYHVKNGTLDQIIDEKLGREIRPECLKVYGKIAHRCLRSERKRRPKMTDVLKALEYAQGAQEGDPVAVEEGIKISESNSIDESFSCWDGGNQVVLSPPCKDIVVHSCPTVYEKTKSQKMLLRFFSEKARGFKWATQPTSRAVKALCFTCSYTLKDHCERKYDPVQ
ncbi:receptor-like protein kinase FERONIA [Humulus lupulus]|uniref:receptor-like protein kinase FERONIA n=1 Tax=Humulus lupulus TaxID=3486 RepID=UPI002B4044E0|nr:receptor-like protein kinase FERONIA [Humulus lupulus]